MDDEFKFAVKQEPLERALPAPNPTPHPIPVIELSSSDSDSSSDESEDGNGGSRGNAGKRRKLDGSGVVLPDGFLDPLPSQRAVSLAEPQMQTEPVPIRSYRNRVSQFGSKQFWKAGDYEDSAPPGTSASSHSTVGMDHVRVHPKFLHSNATSHKWALGAFAELLDNSLDEVVYGATFVNVDMVENKKDGSRMLLIEDNGGGMNPDKMRQCMSLGYSAKSKMANVIGQYGNGFKTSTMRLGADVIVFSRSRGEDGKSPTQSIGMLSYTFLRSTRKEDIVVPMLDYAKVGQEWNKLMRSSQAEWNINVGAIVQWSPFTSEADLFHQFHMMGDQGTRIIIYNLWEDDQGQLELDFDADPHDIQIRGVNRDEKKIEMAKQFPNSRHFLTYRHSLRSYASILYLRVPHGFRFVLRGEDVEHHNIINDMFLTQEITYKPQPGADGATKDSNMLAIVTIGFVKDAKEHIDVQGFNVYHKNRLIKPFWRVWNAAGSDGRGVIGVFEANFVEPAHDKQGFERTTVLARLETRLIQMQKTYWSSLCHKIGYAPRGRQRKLVGSEDRESSPEYSPYQSSKRSKSSTSAHTYKGVHSTLNQKQMHGKDSVPSPSTNSLKHGSRNVYSNGHNEMQTNTNYGNSEVRANLSERLTNSTATKDSSVRKSLQSELSHNTNLNPQNSDDSEVEFIHASNGDTGQVTRSHVKEASGACNGNGHASVSDTVHVNQLEVENSKLKNRLKRMEESFSVESESIRDNTRSLEAVVNGVSGLDSCGQSMLEMENQKLKNSLKQMEESFSQNLQYEKDRCKALEVQLKETEQKIEEMNREQEALIDIFQEERNRRDDEEANLRKKLKEASSTIQQLLDRVKYLEMLNSQNYKPEQ